MPGRSPRIPWRRVPGRTARDSPLLASSRILPPDTGVQVDPAVLPLHLINLLTLVGEAKRAGWARSLWLAQAGTGGDIVFLVVPATGCDADVAATLGNRLDHTDIAKDDRIMIDGELVAVVAATSTPDGFECIVKSPTRGLLEVFVRRSQSWR